LEREGREKGERKGGEGKEWRVKTCCPMSNKLSPPMDVARRDGAAARNYTFIAID